jgi:2EXR family
LRLQIWALAAEVPRIIGLKSEKTSELLLATAACCPLVHACKEAKNEVLRVKRNVYEGKPRASETYVNLAVDTLWLLDYNTKFEQVLSGISESVRRLAVNIDLCRGFLKYSLLKRLRLEELIVVIDYETFGENDELCFVKPGKPRYEGIRKIWHLIDRGGDYFPSWEQQAEKDIQFLQSMRSVEIGK